MNTRYKFLTNLTNYRFDLRVQRRTVSVAWFFLSSDPDVRLDEIIRAFTYEELTKFQSYAAANEVNFPNAKEYQISTDKEASHLEDSSILPIIEEGHPPFLSLRKEPKHITGITRLTSDIILCDAQGRPKHVYDLLFNVIGRVQILEGHLRERRINHDPVPRSW